MNAPVTHRDIEELLGAFALDAVDPHERDLVEAHLIGCPRCRGEVANHRETAALLAQGGVQAPEGLWAKISESLDEAPPALDLAPVASLAAAAGKRRERRSISLRAAAAIGAVAAAVTAFLGLQIGEQDRRVDNLAASLSEDGLRRAALTAMGEPNAEQLWLKTPDGKSDSGAAHVVRLANGTGFIVADHLSPLPADRTYQLWALRPDAKISLAVLGNDPDVASFQMVGDVTGYAITEEAAGGVVSTDRPPVVLGTV